MSAILAQFVGQWHTFGGTVGGQGADIDPQQNDAPRSTPFDAPGQSHTHRQASHPRVFLSSLFSVE
jgi:hypothetical protein